jgi:hypothetical protein
MIGVLVAILVVGILICIRLLLPDDLWKKGKK